jgi:type II secretory ATPase GspE/PulE/Tfp pilus assembly ATPase PilB-like protein
VFAKIKKLAKLDVAERNHAQRGRVRLLNFHGGSAEFEVTTGRIGKGERMTLMRL